MAILLHLITDCQKKTSHPPVIQLMQLSGLDICIDMPYVTVGNTRPLYVEERYYPLKQNNFFKQLAICIRVLYKMVSVNQY